MSERRGLFQIHLMTAIVLMFAAGGLIRLNVWPKKILVDWELIGDSYEPVFGTGRCIGWPLSVSEIVRGKLKDQPGHVITYAYYSDFVERIENNNWQLIIPDIVIALSLLASIAFSCEWFLRRKSKRLNPRRGLFQIHLMTAIVLMFAGGWLIKLNMGYVRNIVVDYEIDGDSYDPIVRTARILGWPFEFNRIVVVHPPTFSVNIGASVAPNQFLSFPIDKIVFDWLRLVADVVIALFILVGLAVFCEWLLRRTKRSKIIAVPPTVTR